MLRGDLGQSPGGWPPALQKKVLKGDKPITARPGSLLKTADLPALRTELEGKLERKVSEFEFASSLMYPKVFSDFVAAQDAYGPVSVLPTPVYFYGMRSEDEIFVDIERGKTLVIRCLAVGDSDDKGMVTVFFELNGQPRRVKVPDRSRGDAASKLRRKAEPGNDAHVGAPMPGVVSTVAVAAGQKVSAGDVLLSIEAMKMETALHAERDGTIAELLVAGRRPDRRQGPAGGVRVGEPRPGRRCLRTASLAAAPIVLDPATGVTASEHRCLLSLPRSAMSRAAQRSMRSRVDWRSYPQWQIHHADRQTRWLPPKPPSSRSRSLRRRHAKRSAAPTGRELVSIRIDRAVLDYFQEDGPGWQDRINDTLRHAIARKPPVAEEQAVRRRLMRSESLGQ